MISAARNALCRNRLLIPLAILLSVVFCTELRAQLPGSMEDCASGTHYLLAFPDTTTNTWDSRFPAQVIRTNTKAFNFYIYSPVDQVLEIGSVGGSSAKVPIAAGQILEYKTDQTGVPLVTSINTPSRNVTRIVAGYPVIVYGYIMTAFGAEAYTAIPVEAWGTEYYAAAWPGENVRNVFPSGEFNYRTVSKQGEGEILIIAAYDSTRVTITPNATLRNCAGCETVTLKAGEAYLVQSTTDTSATAEVQPDLGGTFIQASKRIGVISGNPRIMHNRGERPALAENSFMNMNIEWIPPVEQHGTEFVFMPTWDDRRQRDGLDLEESRQAELVRIFGTSEGKTAGHWINNLGNPVQTVTDTFTAGQFTQEKIGAPIARYYKTSQPALAVSAPYAVVKFNGTTTWGAGYVGASYLSWSSYMVEMVPREQWTSFAPVKAPSLPSSMVHYLNVVTDTLHQFDIYYRQGNSPPQLFPFNRGSVPGSDLVWGSIQLNKGVDYTIIGEGGARFTGYAYGSYRGQEQYRPGGTKRDGEKESSINGGGAGDAEVLHVAEYEEDIALMYGFPLAPSRCVLAEPDQYEIETTQDCDVMLIEITTKNRPASGIEAIYLHADSSENARLEFIQPASPLDLGRGIVTQARVRVVAIDKNRDAFGVVVVKDRTRNGRPHYIQYRWIPDRLEIDPAEVDFGEVSGGPAGEREVVITNPAQKNIFVKRLLLSRGNQGFSITRTSPQFRNDGTDSVRLAPGDSMTIWVDFNPPGGDRYADSIRVILNCNDVVIPLKASAALPCIYLYDLDFGVVEPGETQIRTLSICNRGGSDMTFQDPWFTWLRDLQSQQGFSISRTEMNKLRGRVLGTNECVDIDVTFTAPNQAGTYGTVGRAWTNSGRCRDTSSWRAIVFAPQCLMVEDVDFDTLIVDQSRTRDLRICNAGAGEITFQEPWLTWSGSDFGVAQSEIDKLKGKVLQPNECMTIRVSCAAGSGGSFSTVARIWANTRNCRDTSIWRMFVIDPSVSVDGDESIAGYAIRSVAPNPFTQEARVDFTLGRTGRTIVEVYNGDGELVTTLADETLSAGEHRALWNPERIAAGIYHIRIRSGEWSGSRQVILVR